MRNLVFILVLFSITQLQAQTEQQDTFIRIDEKGRLIQMNISESSLSDVNSYQAVVSGSPKIWFNVFRGDSIHEYSMPSDENEWIFEDDWRNTDNSTGCKDACNWLYSSNVDSVVKHDHIKYRYYSRTCFKCNKRELKMYAHSFVHPIMTGDRFMRKIPNLDSLYTDFMLSDTTGIVMLAGNGLRIITADGEITTQSIELDSSKWGSPRISYSAYDWTDTTEWEMLTYDPNYFFQAPHTWVQSEYEDLNYEYQRLLPYPIGGWEKQGRVCRHCKVVQYRTIYFGNGKNPFKDNPIKSEFQTIMSTRGRQ